MSFYVIGIDHRTIREEIRKSIFGLRDEIIGYCQIIDTGAVAVFNTCNRIEVYGIAIDKFSAWKTLYSLRKEFPDLFLRAYVRVNSYETIKHVLRLACGLESPILGEKQIIDQLKAWVDKAILPLPLRVMWVHVLSAAEDIRLKSGIDLVTSDIVEFVLHDLKERIDFEEQKEIVVIGTGKLAQLLTQKILPNVKLFFASRKKHSRARQLAKSVEGEAILIEDLPERLLSADALISATSSPHYVLRKNHLFNVAPRRKKVIYLYDLAMPKDIEPGVANIKNVFLQDLNSLAYLFRQYNQSFKPFVIRAELLIEEYSENIREKVNAYAYQSRDAAEFIGIETS
jgi:glutamyl-tRNA reductase